MNATQSVGACRNAFVTRPSSSARPARRTVQAVRAQQQNTGDISRREAMASAVAIAAGLLSASPAYAFLGFGENKEETYQKDTAAMIKAAQDVLALGRDDPSRADALAAVKQQTNSWVAKYRREPNFGGRASYGNTYTALNALAGHFNSFGLEAPIPKKRLERINKELEDASRALSRGR